MSFASIFAAFQSTHPVRGGTMRRLIDLSNGSNFNPPTPCGVGLLVGCFFYKRTLFQSTHPVRGGTWTLPMGNMTSTNFNPPTPCGVGPGQRPASRDPCYFNPPTPCGVGPLPVGHGRQLLKFQSTHPVRGGTANIANACNMFYNISNKDK